MNSFNIPRANNFVQYGTMSCLEAQSVFKKKKEKKGPSLFSKGILNYDERTCNKNSATAMWPIMDCQPWSELMSYENVLVVN